MQTLTSNTKLQGIEIERRHLQEWATMQIGRKKKEPASKAIARDYAEERFVEGDAVVVTASPLNSKSAFTRAWTQQIMLERRLASATLDHERIYYHQNRFKRMGELYITRRIATTDGDFRQWLLFATKEELVHQAPICATLYVTVALTVEELHLITSFMPEGGKVIVYDED